MANVSAGWEWTSLPHPGWSAASIMVNLETGNEIGFGDLFVDTAPLELARLCIRTSDEPNAELDAKTMAAFVRAVGDLKRWQFGRDGAELDFPRYSVLGAVSPVWGCSFTAAELNKHIKSDLRLWGE